jgi:hypothetical protein
MSEVDELVASAGRRRDEVSQRATLLLRSGANPARFHRRYIAAVVDLAEEVDVRAVLASQGDVEALERLQLLVGQLERLVIEAGAELAP